MNLEGLPAAVLLSLSAVGLTLGLRPSPGPAQAAPTAQPAQSAAAPADPLSAARAFSGAVRDLCARVGPSMVAIEILEESTWRRGVLRVARRASGVIVTQDGWVVTSHHVVTGAERIRAVLPDGRNFEADPVALDPETDLAILRIEATDLPFAELSERDRPEVGEWVLAMGNPRGLDLTVTQGIVSGAGRSNLGLARYEDFIQTDAAINPGNSGGALIDLEGRVIGINTAMGIESEGSVGIGFAVPASFVRSVLESVIEDGRIRRAYLGVNFGRGNSSSVRGTDSSGSRGVRLQSVVRGGPAQKAGLKAGDLVERFDDREVTDTNGISIAIGMSRPGRKVAMVVWRDGERLELEVELGERGQ